MIIHYYQWYDRSYQCGPTENGSSRHLGFVPKLPNEPWPRWKQGPLHLRPPQFGSLHPSLLSLILSVPIQSQYCSKIRRYTNTEILHSHAEIFLRIFLSKAEEFTVLLSIYDRNFQRMHGVMVLYDKSLARMQKNFEYFDRLKQDLLATNTCLRIFFINYIIVYRF